MSANRKYFPHGSVLFVSSRTEQGLPLVCSLLMNFIIWGILAKARSMYRIKVCHFVFMSNHLHMILVVESPQDVSRFMGYVKGEIAHAVNRLLGRRQRTIWQAGYDSPHLLTADDVVSKIRYIYGNPVSARLVHTIEEYPGVSSWEMFAKGEHSRKHQSLPRDLIPALVLPALSITEQKRMLEQFQELELNEFEFVLEPDAWRKELGAELEYPNEALIEDIEDYQRELKSERLDKNQPVLGATSLRRESMLKEYQPKKYSRKMICISSDKELRRRFIAHFKALAALAAEAYQSWKFGCYKLKIPPGMFCPRMPETVSALSVL